MRYRVALTLAGFFAATLMGASSRAAAAEPAPAGSDGQVLSEAAKAAELFERAFQAGVDQSPEFQTALGEKTNYSAWDDVSDARAVENLSRGLGFLAELKRTVDPKALDHDTLLSYRLFEYEMETEAAAFRFRHDHYVFTQTGGLLAEAPDFLINQHRVDNVDDARAYIARLHALPAKFAQCEENLRAQVARSVIPPKWAFPRAIEIGRNVITGQPFGGSGDSPLWADITAKVAALENLDARETETLLAEARAALVDSVKPAYEHFLAELVTLEKSATSDDGVWKFPDGAAFYNHQLSRWTTTSLTAEEIHAIGLSEVARIQAEMEGVMREVGFAGDLQAFFTFLREDSRFYFPANPEGRRQYLDRATAVVEEMKSKLDLLFLRKPRADLIVKATEEFQEKSAPKAFYQSPAPNGARPGMYYVTLYDMREMPTYQLEAIAYHEGIPGHHMQIAIAQELKGLPRFRRFGGYGAYSEGWGLYCELLPREIGLYQDPYSNFGRLSTELWRAVRLVVDTGIHAKRWTREQAIDYFVKNAPLNRDEVVREVERYIVNPGQATSYKIGMLKIMELRELARRELGAKFDIREFHDVVLRDGSVPLAILEEQVPRVDQLSEALTGLASPILPRTNGGPLSIA